LPDALVNCGGKRRILGLFALKPLFGLNENESPLARAEQNVIDRLLGLPTDEVKGGICRHLPARLDRAFREDSYGGPSRDPVLKSDASRVCGPANSAAHLISLPKPQLLGPAQPRNR